MGCETAYLNNDSSNRLRWVRIIGPASTIENLKILLPAVLVQMEGAAAKAARAHAAKLPGWLAPHERAAETATVRRSFMRGFGQGIKDKLQQARGGYADQLRAEAALGDVTSASRELVLISREQRVATEFNRLFPKLGTARESKRFSHDAYRRGVGAGRKADIGQGKINNPTSRPELG